MGEVAVNRRRSRGLFFGGMLLAVLTASCSQAGRKLQEKLSAGRDALARKQYDLAIENFSEAIELDADNAVAYRERGQAYHGKKDFDRALADFAQALRLDPRLDQ